MMLTVTNFIVMLLVVVLGCVGLAEETATCVWPTVQNLRVGDYTVQMKQVPAGVWCHGLNVVEVSLPYLMPILIDWAVDLLTFNGQDITGDGWPDIVVLRYTGGAHCCYEYLVLSLGPQLTIHVLPFVSGGPAEFVDLDGDGIYEVMTRDWDVFFSFCWNAGHPYYPRVVLSYETGKGYVPVTPRFPMVFAEELVEYRELAEKVRSGEFGEGTDCAKCAVLKLVLAYLYLGNPDLGWVALYHYYPFGDVEDLRAAIERELLRSRVYVP